MRRRFLVAVLVAGVLAVVMIWHSMASKTIDRHTEYEMRYRICEEILVRGMEMKEFKAGTLPREAPSAVELESIQGGPRGVNAVVAQGPYLGKPLSGVPRSAPWLKVVFVDGDEWHITRGLDILKKTR